MSRNARIRTRAMACSIIGSALSPWARWGNSWSSVRESIDHAAAKPGDHGLGIAPRAQRVEPLLDLRARIGVFKCGVNGVHRGGERTATACLSVFQHAGEARERIRQI